MTLLTGLWQNRWIRRSAWTLATLSTLYVLMYCWLNWRWGRQWDKTLAMLKAEGETIDFHSIANPPIPEAENFCAIALLRNFSEDTAQGESARKQIEALKLPDGGTARPRPELMSPGYGKATDLKAWADWLRQEGSLPIPVDSGDAAADLTTALSKHDALVAELAAGLNRPKAQWLPEWKTRELPEMLLAISLHHYTPIQTSNQSLSLRAVAAARSGNVAKAHESTLIMTRLAQANLNDPFIIGLLVAAANTAAICSSTWELCDAQAGSAEDFTKLEAALAELDFKPALLRAFRGEMAASAQTLQFLGRNPAAAAAAVSPVSMQSQNNDRLTLPSLTIRAIPQRFFDANAAVLAERELTYLIKPLRDHGWKESRAAAADCERDLQRVKAEIWTHPTDMISGIMVPVFGGVIDRAIYAQALVNQAIIACALERYRIANGSYPESLDAVKLVNGHPLPLDVMNNQPMGYRLTPDGKFMLWSIGFDGRDDGGKRVLDERNPEKTRFHRKDYAGDWVWSYFHH